MDWLKKLEHAYEYKLNLLWENNIRSLNNFDANMKTGLQLCEYIGEVRTAGTRLHIP